MIRFPWARRRALPQPNVAIDESGDPSGSALGSMVRAAFDAARAGERTLPNDLLDMEGMSGGRYRELINRLIKRHDAPSYLEIGSWKGSTLCAAIHGNPSVTALAIDNWSEFGGPRDAFFRNLAQYAPAEARVSVLNVAMADAPFAALGPFNVYLFDGPHEREDHRAGLLLALPALADTFILIVDDWNWSSVRDGTRDALEEAKLEIEYRLEIRTTLDDQHPGAIGFAANETSEWHNGYSIAVIRKPSR